MNQAEFARIFCHRPQGYAWFLGAGASHNANLPTAEDIITDLKRRFYCSEENQKLSTKDLQNDAVRDQVEAYMQSRGFPERWSETEYSTYFETIFGNDRERQRQYISGMLADDRVRLSVGNRVFGAMMATGLCRAAFTTNFDPVVEKAVAELSGTPLSAYHLEGAHNAVSALNNEQYPLYCKLHGDFQYDSIKNLASDLATQNDELSKCMAMAGGRFGFVVAGYSGRDESIMDLFRAVLAAPNPFPHGLYWMKMRGSTPLQSVAALIADAEAAGVRAAFVDVDTYDTVMLRLWRNLPALPDGLDAKVRKGRAGTVQIAMPSANGGKPVMRFNGLPMTKVPTTCARVSLKRPTSWDEIADLKRKAETSAVVTFDGDVLAWGGPSDIENSFGADFLEKSVAEFDPDWRTGSRLHIKNFLEEGLARALSRERPLLQRRQGSGISLIVDHKAQDVGIWEDLFHEVGKVTGLVPGLTLPANEEREAVNKVHYAEALHISLNYADGRLWLLLTPDVWIWPTFARRHATNFLDRRKADRRNDKYDRLLSVWIDILSDHAGRNAEVNLSPFEGEIGFANPAFGFSTQTGFAMKRGKT
jgi:SIR2-like domain